MDDGRSTMDDRRSSGLNPQALSERVDRFLASRGLAAPTVPVPSVATTSPDRPAAFVCEEDVRQALKAGTRIVIDSRSIVTPSARDLGEEKRIFVDSR
jgi:hypothetical protein